jgi:nucleoside-diphosphate-sugar epimerase
MTVLVTGATGFVGGELVRRLLERGDTVRALVRPETLSDPARRADRSLDGVGVIPGGLEDPEALRRAVDGVEVAHHLAAVRWEDPHRIEAVNVDGTRRLVQACVAAGVRRIVFTSSSAVYGFRHPPRTWPIGEGAPLDGNLDYAQSKVRAEEIVRGAQADGVEHTILRPTLVYGPAAGYVEELVRDALDRPAAIAARTRGQTCQPIHVRDLGELLIAAGWQSGAAGATLNAAGTELVPTAAIVALAVQAAVGRGRRPVPGGPARHAHLKYDIARAAQLLQATPRVTLEEGVAEIVRALQGDASDDVAAGGGWADGGWSNGNGNGNRDGAPGRWWAHAGAR